MFKKITSKLILLFFLIGLLPIILYGAYSITKSKNTSIQTAVEGNKGIANQVAGRVYQYLHNSELILNALAENINRANLKEWQRETILRNYAINFEEFTFLRIIDLDGNVIATSEIVMPKDNYKKTKGYEEALFGKIFVSGVFMTDDLVPATHFFLPMKKLNEVDAVLMAEVDLLHMWHLVESLKIGQEGFLSLITPEGQLFASGDGGTKILAIGMKTYPAMDQLKSRIGQSFEAKRNGRDYLVVSSQLPPPFRWIITVEQPINEAYALSLAMSRQLVLIVVVFLILMVGLGMFLGNQQIAKPVAKIMRRIREIAGGKIKGEVQIKGQGEFVELAETLNQMSDELITIQEELVKQEKHALLGQIASSIAHDIKHPIASVENYTKLLEVKHQDEEYRQLFLKTVKREFEKIHVFLENLRDLTKDIPFKPVKTSLNKIIDEVLQAQMPNFEKHKIKIQKDWDRELDASIDLFSFQRVLTNVIHNAIEAMPEGGVLTTRLQSVDHTIVISVKDTGAGIPKEKIETLFDDFVTTKRSGLGLGLAIVKKIMAQHRGLVDVQSEPNHGTCFNLILPT